MINYKFKILLVFFLSIVITTSFAQQAFVSGGSNASGSGGTASYSIGQIVYTTNSGVNGSVAQGVQQPYEISVISGIKQTIIKLSVSAYPNPTTDYLILEVDDLVLLGNQSISYQLFDMSGNLLQSKKIIGNQTNIVTSNLASANYLVRITKGNEEVKVFKIIKN